MHLDTRRRHAPNAAFVADVESMLFDRFPDLRETVLGTAIAELIATLLETQRDEITLAMRGAEAVA